MSWLARRGTNSDVFFLGAGFSIAASALFPDTNSLGRRVLERDDGTLAELTRGVEFTAVLTFESWLTRLAEKQPYDTEEARFRRASLFARAQTLIAEVLLESLASAVDGGLPGWVYDLVEVLHLERSTVVTLNYDTLLELAIDRTRSFSKAGDTRADANRALNYISIPIGTWDSLSARTTRTLRLFKLHGSVDWFWVPGDLTGTSLIRHGSGAPKAQAQVAGRSRYIVPPTTTKSPYFDNAVSRYMWSETAMSLATCRRVVFMGYSLPITDVAIASLIAEHLNRDAEVWIADLSPESVAANLNALGVDRSRLRLFDGLTAISDAVGLLAGQTHQRVLEELRAHLAQVDDRPVALYWDREHSAAVLSGGFQMTDGKLSLRAELVGPFAHTNRSRTSDASAEVLRSGTFATLLEGARELVVHDETSREWAIADFGAPEEWVAAGYSRAWLALKGAGTLADDSVAPPRKPFDLRNQPRIYTGTEEPAEARDGDVWLGPGATT
jgi:hypothetical protein